VAVDLDLGRTWCGTPLDHVFREFMPPRWSWLDHEYPIRRVCPKFLSFVDSVANHFSRNTRICAQTQNLHPELVPSLTVVMEKGIDLALKLSEISSSSGALPVSSQA